MQINMISIIRKLCCVLLIVTTTTSTITSHHLLVTAMTEESSILEDLARSIKPTPPGWSTSRGHCSWSGVSCDPAGQVIAIVLPFKHLSGELPGNLNELSKLKNLDVRGNMFSGPVTSISGLKFLEHVFLGRNNFSDVPNPHSFFVGLKSLQTFSISDNPTLKPWSIPESLTDASLLTTLDARKCGLVGPIPDMSKCIHLSYLQLQDNQLTGVVPPSLSSLSNLARVSLHNNKLQGPAPVFRKGVEVSIRNNNFCTASFEPCEYEVSILLEVASAIGYPMSLAEGWKGNDACHGWKYVSCNAKGKVSGINLGKQDFTGTISDAIAKLSDLRILHMNDNKLVGSIPVVLTSLTQLQLLDIANNNISGTIPKFAPDVLIRAFGNPSLAVDFPSPSPSGGGDGNGTHDRPDDRSSHGPTTPFSNPWTIGAVIVGILVFVVAFVVLICKCVVKKDKTKESGVKMTAGLHDDSSDVCNVSEIQFYDGGHNAIPFEVLKHVTNNFSKDNIIGHGGSGTVYRGTLPEGIDIAVKKMELGVASPQGMEEFKAELEVLTKVRHRNLVSLQGFCIDSNVRLLVYEYMPNGTLEERLFEWNTKGYSPLTWKQRLTIILDVARGVEYLHTLANQSFIHRDLKTSNILLGEGMRAKVSDFGLVKTTPNDGIYTVETAHVAGTFGYLAPEYAGNGIVSTKTDVFAYGVVLMEILTGKRAVDSSFPEGKGLVSWLRKNTESIDKIEKYIDPSLGSTIEDLDGLMVVAKLAGQCTSKTSSHRPKMAQVVTALSTLLEEWRPSDSDEEDRIGIDICMSLCRVVLRDSEQLDDMTSTSYSYNESSSSVKTHRKESSCPNFLPLHSQASSTRHSLGAIHSSSHSL